MQKTIDSIVTKENILRKKSKPTTWGKIRELELIERLKASNDTAWTKGVGLAAIQIGVPLQVSWFIIGDKEYILVNPVITKAEIPVVVPKEGCLSLPDIWVQTKRYRDIRVRTLTEEGTEEILSFSGFPAIVVQHEIDHMHGILNIDRVYVPPEKVERNAPCPCGSGKKYKKCCINKINY